MSGLLDKANKEADKSPTEAMNSPKAAVIEVEPKVAEKLATNDIDDSSEQIPEDPSINALLLQLVGIVGCLLYHSLYSIQNTSIF